MFHLWDQYFSKIKCLVSFIPSCLLPRFVTKLLEDLVFFVVDIPNSGQDVLEIMVNKPNRERQKLMREQNILKQVEVKQRDLIQVFGVPTELNLLLPFCFRSSSFSKPLSQTAVTAPCFGWRSLGISAMHHSGIFAGFVTEFSAIPSRIIGRTK